MSVATELADVDDAIVACRAWGHKWPELVPGRPLPRGFRPRLLPDRCVEITETCARCGKIRRSDTLENGIFDLGVVRRYADPRRWKVTPNQSRRDYQGEAYRRMQETIMLAATVNAMEDEQAPDGPPGAPQARFSGGAA